MNTQNHSNIPEYSYTLYSTLGCHLCDDAKVLITENFSDVASQVGVCDIATDDELITLYGERIPVLESHETGDILCWPFEVESLRVFFSSP